MKRPNWIVGDYSIRPGGKPDQCAYCQQPKGEIHKEDCVIRHRTVVVKVEITYAVEVPEDWTEDQILFQRNDGSWCADNGLQEIAELQKRLDADTNPKECYPCFCSDMIYSFVREATEMDEKQNQLFVEKCES